MDNKIKNEKPILKGDPNIIIEQRKVADKFIKPFKKNPNVIGIMYLGSVAREFGTRDSDIDISIFSYDKLDIEPGERHFEEWEIDLFNIILKNRNDNWTEAQKEAYYEGKIVYDPNNTIKSFMNTVLKYDEEYRLTKIIHILFKLGWNGWIHTAIRGKNWKGYTWDISPDAWIKRNSVENAYYMFYQCINLTIDLVYAINYRWLPDPKWKYLKSFRLPWLPEGWKECMNFLITGAGENSIETFYKKVDMFQKVIDSCYEKIMDILPKNIYAHLLKNTDEYK